MNIKEIIERNKLKKDPMGIDWRSLAEQVAEEVTKQALIDFQAKLRELVTSILPEIAPEKLKGQVGKTGLRGEPGRKPIPGVDFRIPKDGKEGKAGPRGKDGISIRGLAGKDGKAGKNGKPGKDGSPDKPLKIAEKLNTLTEKVDRSVIKGLERDLGLIRTSVQRSLREKGGGASKGGGMGNVQHETKEVSTTTTTISTNYKIAGGGFAIWAYYQSALIVRGEHYSVGSDQKTITLLFTAQDAQKIDIIYVRT